MMKTGRAPTGFRLTLVYMGLLLVTGLAFPTAAGAQARGEHDVPEQLWQTYPLDPAKAETDTPETVQPQPSPPAQAETDSAVQTTSDSPNAQAQPSGESDSGRSLAFPLLGALLGLLVGLFVLAGARSGAFAIAGEYLARARSPLVSPLRAATNAPRYVGRGGAAVVSPLRTLPRLPRRIGHFLLWPLRAVAGIVTHVVRSVGSAVAAAGQASRTVLHERGASLYLLLFYTFTLLVGVGAGAGVGLLVTLLLQP
jgi:hypothetical protein